MRCFLAVEIPTAIQSAIQEATAGTRGRLGSELVRWVPWQNVHLTLKFLGETSSSSLEAILNVMNAVIPSYQAFSITVRDFGAYPNRKRSRVLWVGVNAPKVIESMQHQLDEATARLGYSSEAREFSPHLTIGRVRSHLPATSLQRVREEVGKAQVGDLGIMQVEAVQLFKSDLLPTGSKYTKLLTVRLEGGQT